MEYKYGMTNRPPAFGGVPHGLRYEWDQDFRDNSRNIRHGVITCERQLTKEEIHSFELVDMLIQMYKGTDDFTGIEYSFSLSDVELRDGMIICNIQTDMGSCRIGEHVSEGGIVYRTDSNMMINDIENLECIFDLSEKPGLMPVEDYLPLVAIYDALDEELKKRL